MKSAVSMVWELVIRRHRFATALIVMVNILSSLLEVVGIGLILPFMKIIADPTIIERTGLYMKLHQLLGAPAHGTFIIYVGSAFAGYMVFKNGALLVLWQLQTRQFNAMQVGLSKRLMNGYLHGPYVEHLRSNSADIMKAVTGDLQNLFFLVLSPMFITISETMVAVGIAMVLIFAAPTDSLVALVVLLVLFAAFYLLTQQRMRSVGREGQLHVANYMRITNQAIGGIADVKMCNAQHFYIDAFTTHVSGYLSKQLVSSFFARFPRYAVEALFGVAVTAFILLSLGRGMPPSDIVALVGLFAVAAMRLLPSINRIVIALANIKQYAYCVELVQNDINRFAPKAGRVDKTHLQHKDPFTFNNNITFEAIGYTYPGTQSPVVQNISFEINKGECVALAGESGSGKTTLANIVLGLLEPTMGSVMVDGHDIHQNSTAWQRQIGYVPQSVYLCDGTIRANVAFGIAADAIDDERVWSALTKSMLAEHVRQLPQQLEAMVGERGIALSGGQRQRLGIARALYRNPAVLVLDEATSALDGKTEVEIGETVAKLRGEVTAIVIAHRPSTIRQSDRVIYLRHGRVQAHGTFKELVATCESFATMIAH
jgi:ATP-binding cassette subfamily C protein